VGRGWKRVLPVLISTGLLAWVVYRVSPQALVEAAGRLDARPLVAATALLVLALYFWDAVCLDWLFGKCIRPLSYPTALAARGWSYLPGALNYELGQAALAWRLARAQETTVLSALGLCVQLAYHDLVVLFVLGGLGSLVSTDPRSRPAGWVCGLGLAALAGFGVLVRWLPRAWRRAGTALPSWLPSWSAGRSAMLLLLRGVYYGIILGYAAVGLEICRIGVSFHVLGSVIPLVLLADGLPISVSGLGTRETTLLYLLQPDEPATLAAFSLFWSVGLASGRAGIGLLHWWIPRERLDGKAST
jgi:hypothetical protein